MTKKPKSPEITRLIQFMSEQNETPETMAEKSGISERTIKNYLWNDQPIGGQLIRALVEIWGISADWLLTGYGPLFIKSCNQQLQPLIHYIDHTDPDNLQDFWWLAARCTEQSMIQSGAQPGINYTITDLYQLAQPFVLDKYKTGELTMTAYAENP